MIEALLWGVTVVAFVVGVILENRWHRSGVATYLYASYAAFYGGMGALVLNMWRQGEHWWLYVSAALIMVMLPWMIRSHRRKVRKGLN